jgi:transmembrane sensor
LPWVGEDTVVTRRVRPMGGVLGVAAAAAVLIAAVAAVWLLAVSHREVPVVKASTDIVIATNRGETRQVVLPDGSTLELNAGTEVRYPATFSGKERLIVLEKGEAYFQVVADATRPFVVESGKVRTTVLGTSFDIRDYQEEGSLQVAVLSGKVAVSGRVLDKGMLVRVDGNGVFDGRFDTDAEVAAWKTGGLYFKDASFGQIAFDVFNKYNIRLINKSPKRVWSYTGLFRNESLQEVVETLCQTEGLKYRFIDGELVIF